MKRPVGSEADKGSGPVPADEPSDAALASPLRRARRAIDNLAAPRGSGRGLSSAAAKASARVLARPCRSPITAFPAPRPAPRWPDTRERIIVRAQATPRHSDASIAARRRHDPAGEVGVLCPARREVGLFSAGRQVCGRPRHRSVAVGRPQADRRRGDGPPLRPRSPRV